MIGPNLSEWALRTRQLTIYMMIVGDHRGRLRLHQPGP